MDRLFNRISSTIVDSLHKSQYVLRVVVVTDKSVHAARRETDEMSLSLNDEIFAIRMQYIYRRSSVKPPLY